MPPSRLRVLAAAAAITLAGAACAADAPPPAHQPPGSVGVVPTLLPAGDGTGAPASPVGDVPAALGGAFRRGGVPVPADLEAAVAETCRAKPVPPYVEEIGSRPVVVTDMRGLGVILVVFADADGATGCRVAVAADGSMRADFFPVREDPSKTLDEGGLTLGAMQYVQDGTSQRAIAVGRAGDRAVHVRAGFDDDTYVTATLRDGWYAMWWPGQVRAAVVVATDNRNEAMGTVTPP